MCYIYTYISYISSFDLYFTKNCKKNVNLTNFK